MSFVPDCAMVFAAGLGTRMRPVTDTLPKPLVEVGGRAMLDHMLDRLAELGVGTAIVNVHHLPGLIEAHLAGRTVPRILISDERDRLLDQGGGIRKVLPLLGTAPFLICNTDALWTERTSNLARLCAEWIPASTDIALLVASTTASVGVDWTGDFLLDAGGRLSRRSDGGPMPFVYAGVGLVKPELFAGIDETVFRLAPFFFRAAEAGRLGGTLLEGTWLHVGTPGAVAEAEAALRAVPL